MKVKPIYFYLVIIFAAAVFLIIAVNKTGSNNTSSSAIPNDEIHQNRDQLFTNPGSSNVSAEFKHKMEMLKKAVEKNPYDTAAVREYADLLSASHQEKESIKYYQAILDIDPSRADIYFQLTFVYYNLKDFENAKRSAEKVIMLDPVNHQAFYNLGAINAAQGNKLKAKEIWINLIEKFPTSASSNLARESLEKL